MIDFPAEGGKAPPYDQVFKSSGLQFDLYNISHEYFTSGRTESRREELLEQIETMTEGRDVSVNVKELERLHGRLAWFNAFVFGLTLKAAVEVIRIPFTLEKSQRMSLCWCTKEASCLKFSEHHVEHTKWNFSQNIVLLGIL